MKFKVDREMCQSAAVCIGFMTKTNKQIFELDDQSKAEIVAKDKKVSDAWVEVTDVVDADQEKIESLEKTVIESARSCPFNAIIVKDDKGKQLWPE